MKSDRLRRRARLSELRAWRINLLLACCFLSVPSACRAHPHRVDLHWNAPTISPVPVVGYNVYRSADGGEHKHCMNCPKSSPLKDTKYTDYLVQSGRTYTYWVTSLSASGTESVPSNIVDVTIPK